MTEPNKDSEDNNINISLSPDSVKDLQDFLEQHYKHFILPPTRIPKYLNQLVIPPVYEPTTVMDPNTGEVLRQEYTVDVSQFEQQILPSPFPKTTVWGYGGQVKDSDTGEIVYFQNTPGATFEATRGIPVHV